MYVSFVKGMLVGMTVGAGAGMLMAMPQSKRRDGKRMVGRAVKNIGEMIEDVTEMFGH